MSEIESLLSQAVPAVGAAVSAYGAAVLTRAEDEAAGATVRLGQRLLDRLLQRGPKPAAVESAVADLVESGDAPYAWAVLRLRVHEALAASPELRAEWAALLPAPPAGPGTSTVTGTVSVGGDVTGIVSTGPGTTNVVRRDAR